MTRRIVTYSAAGLLVTLIWFLLVYAPIVKRKEALDGQISRAEQQLVDFNRTLADLPSYLQTSNNLERFKNQLNSSLYAKNDILALLEQITRDAVNDGLAVVEISPPVTELLELNRATRLEGEPQFLNITLDLSGRYLDFGRYITHLESTPYFRRINSCSARSGRNAESRVKFTVSFKALIGAEREST